MVANYGTKADMPVTLPDGTLYIQTDTNIVYIGTDHGNVRISPATREIVARITQSSTSDPVVTQIKNDGFGTVGTGAYSDVGVYTIDTPPDFTFNPLTDTVLFANSGSERIVTTVMGAGFVTIGNYTKAITTGEGSQTLTPTNGLDGILIIRRYNA